MQKWLTLMIKQQLSKYQLNKYGSIIQSCSIKQPKLKNEPDWNIKLTRKLYQILKHNQYEIIMICIAQEFQTLTLAFLTSILETWSYTMWYQWIQ